MKSFQIKPHVADTRLAIKAASFEKLFEVALLGMNQILKKGFCKKVYQNSLRKEIKIESNDKTNLLVDFLSEVLTLSQIQRAVFCHIKIVKLRQKMIEAVIFGSNVNSFDEDIKAVSYHEAEVQHGQNAHWQTTIVFDI